MAEILEFKWQALPGYFETDCEGPQAKYSGRYVREADYNKLLERHRRLVDAANGAIPCLTDWIATTGFGAVNRRDKQALAGIEAALAEEVE